MCKAHANHDQPLPPFSQTCMAPTTLHLVGGLLRDFSPLLGLKSKIFHNGGCAPAPRAYSRVEFARGMLVGY